MQRFQRGKLIVVLQYVLYPKIFPEQLNEGFFLFFGLNVCGFRETRLQLAHDIYEATSRLSGKRVREAFHVLVITFFHHHAAGITFPEQGNGIHCGLL